MILASRSTSCFQNQELGETLRSTADRVTQTWPASGTRLKTLRYSNLFQERIHLPSSGSVCSKTTGSGQTGLPPPSETGGLINIGTALAVSSQNQLIHGRCFWILVMIYIMLFATMVSETWQLPVWFERVSGVFQVMSRGPFSVRRLLHPRSNDTSKMT